MNSDKNNKKKGIVGTISIVVILLIAFIFGGTDSVKDILEQLSSNQDTVSNINENPNVKNQLKVHFIDVGQGDSVLIQNQNSAILIDGGTRESEDRLISYLNSQQIKTFDYVVATHPHEDHIGGLDRVIKDFDVKNIWMPKKSASTKVFKDLATEIKNKGLKAVQPNVGESIKVADITITPLAPVKSSYDETNDWSIVLKVKYKDNSFLFTGDAESTSESDIIEAGLDLKSDILKLGHHGSSTSTSKNFLDKVNPKYAVISLGAGNSYGHPHIETLNALKSKNIPVYRTDKNGAIVATSDGNKIVFEVQKGNKNGYTDAKK